MNRLALHLPVLLALGAAAGSARADSPQTPVMVGDVPLSLGIDRAAARAALKANSAYLVSRLGESRLVVVDTKVSRALAILTFDRQGRLVQVQNNRTPDSDTALAFALALHEVAEAVAQGPAERRQPCTWSAARKLPVGPYAWLRDPGKPDVDLREIHLTCGKRAILIHVRMPTGATKVVGDVLAVERVLLYESVGEAPEGG